MACATASQMKQVQERHLSICVTKCLWSPKMDLLLTANSHGHVLLQRHRSLQRVWQFVPPMEHAEVTGMSWRPDSNVIAIGYQTGLVVLVTLETGAEVHKFEVTEGVTSLSWQQHATPAATTTKDIWSEYMTPLPAPDAWFTETGPSEEGAAGDHLPWQSSLMLSNQLSLTTLVVGTASAKVLLYAFGLVHCATVDVAKTVPGAGKVLDAQCSQDMNALSVLLEKERGAWIPPQQQDQGKQLELKDVAHVLCDVSVISEHHKELFTLTRKFAEIQSLFSYSTDAISQLRELWEGIMLEMDKKLDAYPGLKDEGQVSADFLDLLVFGHASVEFFMFLRVKLSDKLLKKLRQSVELSYTNMHKLVVKQLEAVGQGLVFVMSQLLGMSRTTDRFGLLGLEEEGVLACLKEAGAFLLKTGELQQVIAHSMRDFLAFLKWLYLTHLRISDNNITADLLKTTQQATSHVVNFLHDTLEEIVLDKDGNKHRQFRLEGLGQYFKDEDLKRPPDSTNNPWVTFIAKYPELNDHPLILPQRRNTSLTQEYSILEKQIDKMTAKTVQVIGENINISKAVSLFSTDSKTEICISQRSNSNSQKMNLIVVPEMKSPIFYFCQWDTGVNEIYDQVTASAMGARLRVAPFTFTRTQCLSSSLLTSANHSGTADEHLESEDEFAPIIGVQFYTTDVVSVLLQGFSNVMCSLFVQLPVADLEANLVTVELASEGSRLVNAIGLVPVDLSKSVGAASVRRLDIAAGLFGVSGERKVTAVVAQHRRTMVLYEMEVDDDDEEEEEEELELREPEAVEIREHEEEENEGAEM